MLIQLSMGPVAQLVASKITDPGVVSLIPAQPHTSVEIDHEILESQSTKKTLL